MIRFELELDVTPPASFDEAIMDVWAETDGTVAYRRGLGPAKVTVDRPPAAPTPPALGPPMASIRAADYSQADGGLHA